MGLFGKKRAEQTGEESAAIKVLGSGCAKCNQLEESVKTALTQLGLEPEVGHIRDFSRIAEYGVMTTPALVVDEKVVSSGRVLKPEEAAALIRKARGME